MISSRKNITFCKSECVVVTVDYTNSGNYIIAACRIKSDADIICRSYNETYGTKDHPYAKVMTVAAYIAANPYC